MFGYGGHSRYTAIASVAIGFSGKAAVPLFSYASRNPLVDLVDKLAVSRGHKLGAMIEARIVNPTSSQAPAQTSSFIDYHDVATAALQQRGSAQTGKAGTYNDNVGMFGHKCSTFLT
jgi:hypothetical protein